MGLRKLPFCPVSDCSCIVDGFAYAILRSRSFVPLRLCHRSCEGSWRNWNFYEAFLSMFGCHDCLRGDKKPGKLGITKMDQFFFPRSKTRKTWHIFEIEIRSPIFLPHQLGKGVVGVGVERLGWNCGFDSRLLLRLPEAATVFLATHLSLRARSLRSICLYLYIQMHCHEVCNRR